MPQIFFGLKDLFSTQPRRGIVRPVAPFKSGSILLIPDRVIVRDGNSLNLPVGSYTIEFPGSEPFVTGHFDVSGNADFADLFIQDAAPYPLPPLAPISAIASLQAILDSKVDDDDPRLDQQLSPEDQAKLDTLQSAAFQPASNFANSSQGSKADSALQSSAIGVSVAAFDDIRFSDERVPADASITLAKLSPDFTLPWSLISGTPATLEDYGIVDAATATQGAKADSALQPGAAISTITGLQIALDSKANLADLGSAAFQPTSAFASSAQGIKADSALQSGTPIVSISGLQTALDSKPNTADLGSAAFQPASNFATASQGGKADSALQPNTSISSINGLQSELNSKLDTGSFLSINNSDRLRLTASGGGPSIDLFRAGGITLYHSNNASQPVVISTYNRANSSEYGLAVPLLKCTGGRFDFDPLDNKAEFRVSGLSTEFNIYNVSADYPLFRINSDRTVQTFNTIVSAGGLRANSTEASTSTTTGSGVFAGGVGVAGNINVGGSGTFTSGVRYGTSNPLYFDQQTEPASPTVGTKWLERDSSWNEIATWIWDGTRWTTPLVGYSPPAATALSGVSTRGWTIAYPGFGTGIIIRSISLVGRANGTNHSAANFLVFQNTLITNSNATVNLGAQQNTQTITTAASTKITVSPNQTVTWDNYNSLGTNFSLGAGSPSLNYRMESILVVYR